MHNLIGAHPGEILWMILGQGMALTALLACYVPARRAASVDPLVALCVE